MNSDEDMVVKRGSKLQRCAIKAFEEVFFFKPSFINICIYLSETNFRCLSGNETVSFYMFE